MYHTLEHFMHFTSTESSFLRRMVENVRTFDKSLIPIRAGGKRSDYTESTNVSHFRALHAFHLDGKLTFKKNGGKRTDIRQISDPYEGWRQEITCIQNQLMYHAFEQFMHVASTGSSFLRRMVENVRTFDKSLIPIRAGGK